MQEFGAVRDLGLGIDVSPLRLTISPALSVEYGPQELKRMDLPDLIRLYKVGLAKVSQKQRY